MGVARASTGGQTRLMAETITEANVSKEGIEHLDEL